MLISRWKSQAAGAVGALLFAGQAVQAIDLDLTSSGETFPFAAKWVRDHSLTVRSHRFN